MRKKAIYKTLLTMAAVVSLADCGGGEKQQETESTVARAIICR